MEDDKANSKTVRFEDSVEMIVEPSNGNGNNDQLPNDGIKEKSYSEEFPNGFLTGICKWFNHKTGYGFITSDVDGKEVFVHYVNKIPK